MPTISVIIPAHNSAGTIVEALESVLAQTVEQRAKGVEQRAEREKCVSTLVRSPVGGGLENIEPATCNLQPSTSNHEPRTMVEVIVVDDASSDGTVDKVRAWSEEQRAEGEKRIDIQPQINADEHRWDIDSRQQTTDYRPGKPSTFNLQPSTNNSDHRLQTTDYRLQTTQGDAPRSDAATVDDKLGTTNHEPRTHIKLIALGKNKGPAGARNRGIAEAKGEWIAFLDADDAWLPERLELQFEALKEHPEAGMVCGTTISFADSRVQCSPQVHKTYGSEERFKVESDGVASGAKSEERRGERGEQRAKSEEQRGERGDDREQRKEFNHGIHPSDEHGAGGKHGTHIAESEERVLEQKEVKLVKREKEKSCTPPLPLTSCPLPLTAFAVSNPVATSTVLIRKDVLEDVGGFDEQFRGPEDYDLWMRVATRTVILKIDAPVSMYRHVSGSLSMDDRTFLPQVLGVLEKAFAADGALSDYMGMRKAAISNQYWNASWMAFDRGARLTAVTHLIRAYVLNMFAEGKVSRQWLPLLVRYMFGKKS